MSYLLKTAGLLSLIASVATPAAADQTIANLTASAQTILDQINRSQALTSGAVAAASSGDILAPGVMQTASVTDQMQNAYNNAITGVINANYYTTQELMLDQHEIAMDHLDTAIDSLVDASLVLMTAATVADMAESADTVQEQQALQTILENSPGMAITDTEQGNYNTALGAVQEYAREAGAFLAAANNIQMTGMVDAYTSQANVSLYGATVAYNATADIINISAGNAFGMGFQGFLASNTVSAEDVYASAYQ
jgi:hypothetical protein